MAFDSQYMFAQFTGEPGSAIHTLNPPVTWLLTDCELMPVESDSQFRGCFPEEVSPTTIHIPAIGSFGSPSSLLEDPDKSISSCGSPRSQYSSYATIIGQPLEIDRAYEIAQKHSNKHVGDMTRRTVRRRSRGANVDVGLARGIYLAKNRQAASKCRNKQRRDQEKLVETARVVERTNRALKMEVKSLKDSMRMIMDIVNQHSKCPDRGLWMYGQRAMRCEAKHTVCKTVSPNVPSFQAENTGYDEETFG